MENAYYSALSYNRHTYSDMYEYQFDDKSRLSSNKRKDYDH